MSDEPTQSFGGQGSKRAHTTSPDPPQTRFGRYTIVRVLGEGGMGTVYEAEQENPKRTVALKVIRGGSLSPELLRRFEQESQVLGRLQHPGIAQVYEAGTLEDRRGRARPFFAMEFIKGVSLTEFCTRHKLGTRDRLRLIARICDAVYHAHQKGIIHRDLKPANILVDKTGQPKILDFGVARATDSDVQQATMQTDIGQLIGTVPYMSPEQVSGDPNELDTRSDVYALGVIAYELLAGRLPYDLKRKAIHEAARIIREEEVSRLSTHDRTLRGDVETMVVKALEKDKSRRYQSAESLAADIRRYLRDEPISARPANAWYQISKFSRRDKAVVIGVGAAFVLLLAGVIGTGLALRRALTAESEATARLFEKEAAQRSEAEARGRAEAALAAEAEQRRLADEQRDRAVNAEAETAKRAEELQRVSDFQARVLGRLDPARAGRALSAEVSAKYIEALDREGLPRGGGQRTAERRAFMNEWKKINSTDLARDFIVAEFLKPAKRALDRGFKDEPRIDAQIRQSLAKRYAAIGLYDDAVALQSRALATQRELYGKKNVAVRESCRLMGELLQSQGRVAEAEPYFREVMEMGAVLPLYAKARLLGAQGKFDEGEKYVAQELEQSRKTWGNDHIRTVRVLSRMGQFLRSAGRPAAAEPYLREALEVSHERLKLKDTPETVGFARDLAGALVEQGKFDEAAPLCSESLRLSRRLLGDEHPDTLLSVIDNGCLLEGQGKHSEAVVLLTSVEPGVRKAFTGSNSRPLTVFLLSLGRARAAGGQYALAESNFLEAQQVLGASPSTAELIACTQSLVDLYNLWNSVDPSGGHDARAVEWNSKLEILTTPVGQMSFEEDVPGAG